MSEKDEEIKEVVDPKMFIGMESKVAEFKKLLNKIKNTNKDAK
jgi:hypothetical protein